MIGSPPRGKPVHSLQVTIGNCFDELRGRGVVRHRPHHADARVRFGQGDQLVEPGVGDHGVVIQQNEIFTTRYLDSLIASGGKATIFRIADDLDTKLSRVAHPRKIIRSAVGRSVVYRD